MTSLKSSDYGFVSDGITPNDTAAASLFAAAISPGVNEVILEEGDFFLENPITVTQSGLRIRSQGARLLMGHASAPALILSQCAETHVDGALKIHGKVKKTGGYAVRLENCYRCSFDVRIQHGWSGVEVKNSTQCWSDNLDLRNMAGGEGLSFSGTAGLGSYGLTLRNVQGDNPYQLSYGPRKAWSAGTAFAAGDIVLVNNCILQCVTAGVSATAPTGIPGTDAASMFSDKLYDGTAEWKFVSGAMEWLVMDSHAYSMRVYTAALMNGWSGLVMKNTGGSAPTFLHTFNLECDHNLSNAVVLMGGSVAHFNNPWLGSCLSGSGLYVGSGFGSEWFCGGGGRILGNWNHGVAIWGGTGGMAKDNFIGENSQAAPGQDHGVFIMSNVKDHQITGNRIVGARQGRPVWIHPGNGSMLRVANNQCHGNASNAVFNGATGAGNIISGN